jgi:hypothetical protein
MTETESVQAALAEVVAARKGATKPKTPARADTEKLPVDGDVSMELLVENVPEGYLHLWLTDDDAGRFKLRGLIPVTWGNQWNCRPSFCLKEGKNGDIITKNELSLYLESLESRAARLERDPARLRHEDRMKAVAKARRVSSGLTLSYAGDIGSVKPTEE